MLNTLRTAHTVYLLSVLIAVSLIGCAEESTAPSEPDIALSPSSLTFQFDIETQASQELVVSNVGSATLEVTSIATEATWISVDRTSLTVSAGDSQVITVEVDATGFSRGTYREPITITSNDPDEPALNVIVWLSILETDILVLPDTLDVTCMEGAVVSTSFLVINEGSKILEVTSISSEAPWISFEQTSFSVNVIDTVEVSVVLSGAVAGVGSHEADILIESSDPDEPITEIMVSFAVLDRLLNMVFLDDGMFYMGADNEWAEDDSRPVHLVSLSSFHVSRDEVTQDEYARFDPTHTSESVGGDLPVDGVTWFDAARFCNWLSAREGYELFYNEEDLSDETEDVRTDSTANGYRLPSEAEWEFSCRSGTATDLYIGDLSHGGFEPVDSLLDQIAWYGGNAGSSSHEVGLKEPNSWGLYDMSGNVSEWCGDWYDSSYYADAPSDDPLGPGSGELRVIRGGGWDSVSEDCRSAARGSLSPTEAARVGLRPVRSGG